MPRVVRLSEVWRMLDDCLPGHTRKDNDHYWAIRHKDRVYPRLPLGAHGRRHNPEIEMGYVRSMVRHYDILECAKRYLDLG
jgi:hypothetical protein